ncbi:transglycosylase SLT domain-containing protein [Methylobacterium sp. SD274]|nr:transglycosylase SLT domain-containing protein [Methylobacterium sp. SD274]
MAMSPDIAAIIVAKAKQYGQDPSYMVRQAEIESGGNPNAKNPSSSAGGLYQFIDSTASRYGLTDKFDPVAASDAAARLARDNGAHLTKTLGRTPSAGELYLAHQQGAGGAAKILSNPDAPAASLVGAKAVALNGGSPGMTAAEFAARWTGKFDGSGPVMTMPGDTSQSGRFGISGVEASTNAAPVMATPASEPDAPLDTNKLLQTLMGQGGQQAAPAAPAAPPPMTQPLQRPAQPFDPAAFYALLKRKRL